MCRLGFESLKVNSANKSKHATEVMTTEMKPDVAVVHELCPVTLEPMNEIQLFNPHLRIKTKDYRNHTRVYRKAIAISRTLSEKALKRLGENSVYLIEIDSDLTTEEMVVEKSPYRTGRIAAISEALFRRMFNVPPPENHWTYAEYPLVANILEEGKKVGVPDTHISAHEDTPSSHAHR